MDDGFKAIDIVKDTSPFDSFLEIEKHMLPNDLLRYYRIHIVPPNTMHNEMLKIEFSVLFAYPEHIN